MYRLKYIVLVILLAVDYSFGQISANGNDSLAQMTGRKVMQTFDFEETHGLKLPMYWRKKPFSPGFPHFSEGQLDTRYARSGQRSFALTGDGGSVAFEYGEKRIRVKAGSDCMISGYVRLENATNCRAQIKAALTTRTGAIIPGSENVSALVSMNDMNEDGWALMEVYVPGNFPQASYLYLSIWLLQEEQWNTEGASVSRVFQNNIEAKAWFDDISIFQLPRVILRSTKPGNVFEYNQPSRLVVEVDGVTTLDYRINLDIYDLFERKVFNDSWMLAIAQGQLSQKEIAIDSLGPGWYIARLDIISHNTAIAQRVLRFAILPDSSVYVGRGSGFGISLLGDDVGDFDTAIELTRMLRVEKIKIPVWQKLSEQPGALMTEPQIERKLRTLKRNNIETIATFGDMPNSLVHKFDINFRGAVDIFSQNTELWRDYLEAVMTLYAREIMFWQIGLNQPEQHWDLRVKSVVDKLRDTFPQMFRESVMIVPMAHNIGIDKEQVGREYISLDIANTIKPDNIPAYIEDFRQRGFSRVWANIEQLDRDVYSRDDVLVDFAKRVIYARKGLADMVFINQPWHKINRNGRDEIEPDELFLIFRTIALELSSMTYSGKFELSEGVEALIFTREGSGTLVLWDKMYDYNANPQGTEVQMQLGNNLRAIDMFGDRHPLEMTQNTARLKVKGYPIFISNIDSRLARLRADIKLEPETLEATTVRQSANLQFKNTFGVPITGQILLHSGDNMRRNWVFEPQTINFVLAKDQVFSQSIDIKIPANEVGGDKNFRADFIIEADRSYRLSTKIPFEVQLKGVDIAIFTRRINQNDLLIQKVVVNESEEPISMRSFVDYPDMDHIERNISNLEPGQTTTRNYILPNAQQWLGQYIRIGLYDPRDTRRINYEILIN